MFRSRFSDAFQKSLPHFGPQDVENGVADQLPSEQIERLLCALLGLVLNRKKDVEYVLAPHRPHTTQLVTPHLERMLINIICGFR